MAFNKGRSYGIQYILNGKPSYGQFAYLGNSGVHIVFYKPDTLNPPVSLVASKRKLSVDEIESDGDWAVGDLIDYNSENGTSEEGNSEGRPYGRSFNGKNYNMDPEAYQEGGKKSRKQKKRKSRKQKQKKQKTRRHR
jgi:hypothetical protein